MEKLFFTLFAFLLVSTTQVLAQTPSKTDSVYVYPPNFFTAPRTIHPPKNAKVKPPKSQDLVVSVETNAPDMGWRIGGMGQLGFALNNYGNWSAGAINTTNIDTNIDLFADYQKGKFTLSNTGKFDIGLVGSNAFLIKDNPNTKFWRKSLDIFSITSSLGYKFNDNVSLTLPITFTTQFLPTLQFQPENPGLTANVSALYPSDTNSIVSRFVSPANTTLSVGIKWEPFKEGNSKMQFSVDMLAQSKTTIVQNNDIARIYSLSSGVGIEQSNSTGIYGNIIDVDNNAVQKVRPEFGAATDIIFVYSGIKNVTFRSRMGLFKNFIKNKFNGISDPKNTSLAMDVNWLNKIDFRVPITFAGKTLYFNTTFEHQLIKDADITVFNRKGDTTKGIQSRFFFGASLNYQFGHQR